MLQLTSRLKRLFAEAEPIIPLSQKKEELNKEATRLLDYTPDIEKLRKHFACLVFVYNGLQSGKTNPHSALGPNAAKLAAAFTEQEYEMYLRRSPEPEARFPIALTAEKSSSKGHGELGSFGAPAPILGQLWAVYPSTIYGGYPGCKKGLDELHMNGIYFNRKRVNLLVPYRLTDKNNQSASFTDLELKIAKVEAWMYVGRSELWGDQLSQFNFQSIPLQSKKILVGENGNIVSHYSLTEKYYYFSEKLKQQAG